MNTASIIFDFLGKRYEYDGGLPDAVLDAVAPMFDDDGLWLGGYPPELAGAGVDVLDELPVARWEIEHIGGTIVEIRGAAADGAIRLEDWKHPRIH